MVKVAMGEEHGHRTQAVTLEEFGQRADTRLPGVDDEAVLALGGCDRVTSRPPGTRREATHEHDGLRAGMWGPPGRWVPHEPTRPVGRP